MSRTGKNSSMGFARAGAGGLAIGAGLGTLLWLIEPVWMFRHALPYLGTPLVTVLLVYACAGAVTGVIASVVAVVLSRLTGLGTHVLTAGITGWVLTVLMIGRDLTVEELRGIPVPELVMTLGAMAVWAALVVAAGRRRSRPSGRGPGIAASAALLFLAVLVVWNPLFLYRFPDKDGPANVPNVVLVVVDALRADHLGTYGYDRPTSPNLDRLAESGFVFEKAYSQGNRTIFAMPALFTSMYPSMNGAIGYQTSMVPLGAGRTTIAEMLSRRGYATAGMMTNIYLKTAFGMTQGFDRTEQFNTTRFRFSVYRALKLLGFLDLPVYATGISPRASQVTDRALEWLGRFSDDDPFFLFVHYMDVHHAYQPPPEFEAMFESSPEAAAIDGGVLFQETKALIEDTPPIDFGGVKLERLVDLYDACIRSTDDQIGRLIDAVERRSAEMGRETLVVFTADHGDEFMEHGSLYHVNLAHMELLHVPLIMSAVGGREPARIGALARHIDVLPTIADLTGATVPDSASGTTLVPLMDGTAERAGRVSFAEGDFCTAMITDDWQIMYVDTSDTYRLYDLRSDPRGRVDVAAQHPDVVAELAPLVTEYAAAAAARRETQRQKATAETVRQLRALGYVN